MKTTILQHYYNKLRILLLRKNNYINSHEITQILNINLNLDAHFHQNSILEKKKFSLIVEFISGKKPKIKVLPSEDSITRIRYIISFSKCESLAFLYRFMIILLPQLRFFNSFIIFKNEKKNKISFDLKDLAVFKEVNDNFELFSNLNAIKRLQLDFKFSTFNSKEIFFLLNSFNIPCVLI
jgi:ribosomal protein L5